MYCQKQPFISALTKSCSENMQQIYRRKTVPKCDFNKVVKQLYWNHTSTRLFSFKFAAYFQNTFLSEHLWRAAFVLPPIYYSHEAARRMSEKNLQLKGIVKLQAVWLQIYWKWTSLHVLLRNFTNNISFLYTLLKCRSIYFHGTPLRS